MLPERAMSRPCCKEFPRDFNGSENVSAARRDMLRDKPAASQHGFYGAQNPGAVFGPLRRATPKEDVQDAAKAACADVA